MASTLSINLSLRFRFNIFSASLINSFSYCGFYRLNDVASVTTGDLNGFAAYITTTNAQFAGAPSSTCLYTELM